MNGADDACESWLIQKCSSVCLQLLPFEPPTRDGPLWLPQFFLRIRSARQRVEPKRLSFISWDTPALAPLLWLPPRYQFQDPPICLKVSHGLRPLTRLSSLQVPPVSWSDAPDCPHSRFSLLNPNILHFNLDHLIKNQLCGLHEASALNQRSTDSLTAALKWNVYVKIWLRLIKPNKVEAASLTEIKQEVCVWSAFLVKAQTAHQHVSPCSV